MCLVLMGLETSDIIPGSNEECPNMSMYRNKVHN